MHLNINLGTIMSAAELSWCALMILKILVLTNT